MRPRAAAALGVRLDDPSIERAAHDPFAPDLRHPPMDWFFEPPEWFDDSTKIWIDSDGRAAGWYYHAGVCIIDGNEGECWTPSPSPTGNELFHQGSMMVMDDGTPTIIEVGVIGGGGEHAPAWMSPEAAAAYYADVTKQLLVGRIYDDPARGGFFLGCVLPEMTVAQVDMVRRSALSGDWRWRRQDLSGHRLNAYDAIGPWLVTRPGLPLHRMGYSVMRLASVDGSPPVVVGSVSLAEQTPDYAGDAMWHIENKPEGFEVIDSRTGEVRATCASIEEANAELGRLHETRRAAVIGDADLPIASREREWDGSGAEQRVQAWASSDGSGDPSSIDFERYARAFLYRDDEADPSTVGAYRLGFADVIDGELQAIPRGIFAVAGVLSGARGGAEIPEAEQARIRERVGSLYGRMADEFDDPSLSPPWENEANQGATDMSMTETAAPEAEPEAETAAPDAETSARIDALEARVAELEAALSEMMTSDLEVEDIMPEEMAGA